jgi:hypothetical protein
MTQSKSPVRILGLVKLMNSIRRQLASGVSPNQKNEMVTLVNSALTQVDTICRQYNIRPDHLPKPSSLAYQFLQSIDFNNLPVNQTVQISTTGIRVSGVVNACRGIQVMMLSLAENICKNNKGLTVNSPEIIQINILIRDQVTQIEKVIQKKGSSISNLPAASLHVYQWLKYLEKPRNLFKHINSLSTFLGEFNIFRTHYKSPNNKSPSLSIKIQFFNISALYKIKYLKDHSDLTLHEGFIGASSSVYQALMKSIFSGKSNQSAAAIKAYAISSEFRRIALDMTNTVPPDKASAQGKCYNLYSVFERVNNEYFFGNLSAPRLTWNKRLTRRKFGHFVPACDTIMISISLDDPAVPTYVIEYVMYHELLHYQLGLRVSKSKVYSHTAKFHSSERQYKNFKEAQDFLNSLAGNRHSLGRKNRK